ncbi:MAG: hypothetical protein JJU02_02115 [Cryomorphaceae bacterium]|nr:hypothetical protein [Cryomorphaceae bacterium]
MNPSFYISHFMQKGGFIFSQISRFLFIVAMVFISFGQIHAQKNTFSASVALDYYNQNEMSDMPTVLARQAEFGYIPSRRLPIAFTVNYSFSDYQTINGHNHIEDRNIYETIRLSNSANRYGVGIRLAKNRPSGFSPYFNAGIGYTRFSTNLMTDQQDILGNGNERSLRISDSTTGYISYGFGIEYGARSRNKNSIRFFFGAQFFNGNGNISRYSLDNFTGIDAAIQEGNSRHTIPNALRQNRAPITTPLGMMSLQAGLIFRF